VLELPYQKDSLTINIDLNLQQYQPDKVIVETTRLKLIAGTKELATFELENTAKFSSLLEATIPVTWPPEIPRDALDHFLGLYDEHPDWEGWLTWYAVRIDTDNPTLCGSIGFKGPPDQKGVVEIGYSVLPEFQGKGFATEIVTGLVRWACRQPMVRQIAAETTADNRASVRVLEKNGFVFDGAGQEEGSIRFCRGC